VNSLPLRRGVSARHHAGGRNCTSIDHGIHRRTGFGIEADGVEGVAARLDTHLRQHGRPSTVGQRRGIHKGFGDGLDGERNVTISHRVGITVGGDDANAKVIGIGEGEFRNVARDRAVGQGTQASVQIFQIMLKRQFH